MKKTRKMYQLFCDNCSYKKISDGTGDIKELVQVQTSPIPRGTPFLSPETKKTIVPPPLERAKQFKCPNCGYLIKAREIKEVKYETDRVDGSETSVEGQEIQGESTK